MYSGATWRRWGSVYETHRDDGHVVHVLHESGGQLYSGAKWSRGGLVYVAHRDDEYLMHVLHRDIVQ